MLHGLVPNEILAWAPMTFLPAAWSISLEWQYYLVAPVLLVAFRRWVWLSPLLLVSLVAVLAFRNELLGSYAISASLMGNIHFFLLGIASRLAYPRLAALTFSPAAASAAILFVDIIDSELSVALVIWGIFYSYSLWHRGAPVTGALFRLLTQSRPVQLLGEASYSLYLFHTPLLVVFGFLALDMIPITHESMLAVEIAAAVLALPLSVLIYFIVERPGIRLGQWLAAKIPARTRAAEAFPPPVEAGSSAEPAQGQAVIGRGSPQAIL
jgi:peptidoglycan/LPS O-acetylase OafA/YrhL